MVISAPEKIYTIEKYFELEEHSKVKHEFFNGKIIEMAGADPIHNLIAARLVTLLNNVLDKKEKTFFVLSSDTKIHIPEYNHFVYPDAVVVCEKIELYPANPKAIINPLLIVEVLSPSTEAYDREGKFLRYKTLSSFKEYVLVRQDKPLVNAIFRKKSTVWMDSLAEGLDAVISLKSIGCELSLEKIYKGVDFQ